MPEWLSGMTRNHVGFARAGSNPAAHGFSYLDLFVEQQSKINISPNLTFYEI
jgi:hypothetical protein